VHTVFSAFEKAGVRIGEKGHLTLEPPDGVSLPTSRGRSTATIGLARN
jgi:hypothetical protein